MSAFGNLSGSDDQHIKAMQSNLNSLLQITNRKGKPAMRDVVQATIYYGAIRAHYSSAFDTSPMLERLHGQAMNAYDEFIARAGVSPYLLSGPSWPR